MNQVSATLRRSGAERDPKLAAVGRETLQDRVYAELRRALIAGRFEPGEVLTIQGLAASLSTSTMPVREALGRLISERALEALPNRSARIPLMTRERLDDLHRVRLLVEGDAVERAAARITETDLDLLDGILAEWERLRAAKSGDIGRELDLNQAFHFAIYRAAASAVLLPMIESLWLQSGPCTRAGAEAFAASGESDTALFHHRILESLRKRDAGAARRALTADISRPFALLTRPAGPAQPT
jgi:DNA-binding GntR family transcriptional regulator